MLSKFDLAFEYINKNYKEISNKEKINIIKVITEVLKNGATSTDIIKKIRMCNDNNRDYYGFFKSIKSSGNLLNPDKFYHHNELRIVPGPPKRVWDINTGEIVNIDQEHYLEMKASYTIDDVVKYIEKRDFLSKTIQDINRARGSISFLLKKYDIDFLLFLFDTVNDIYSSKQKFARSLIEVSEYEDEAKQNYEQRITESKINNIDKVIPKKRMLFK